MFYLEEGPGGWNTLLIIKLGDCSSKRASVKKLSLVAALQCTMETSSFFSI